MNFLNEHESWTLLCKIVFGAEDPVQLEEIGRKIASNCKGLPFSIVVIGGLLAKSKQTQEYWKYIAKNLNSIVNIEENERCLKILHTSYDQLPVHLKPCFLYMGNFLEDSKIRISQLIKLWVAEGFLKSTKAKSLEVIAEEYLLDLIDRNLILVSECGSSGKIKFCNIHDLLRDLCLREARKEKFLCVTSQHNLNTPYYEGINTQRRISIHRSMSMEEHIHSLTSASLIRSLICYSPEDLPIAKFRLLRVLKPCDKYLFHGERIRNLATIFQLVNSRYLSIWGDFVPKSISASSFYLLWNLQTLVLKGWFNTDGAVAPLEIWKMHLLRHAEFEVLSLSDPPSTHMDKRKDFVLGNLQTLMGIERFKCDEEVIGRIPNIRKLKISYQNSEGFEVASYYSLNNLGRLQKLESFACSFNSWMPSRSDLFKNLTFPHSLKKLTLFRSQLYWEDMISIQIGSLPLLHMLKLYSQSFIGPKWETVEGQFPSLKYLLISSSDDLECWITESTRFRHLEHLVLRGLDKLEEIPLDIGEIPTLQSIELDNCSYCAIISAKQILEEQEELGNEDLQVQVQLWEEDHQLQSLASRNFQVTICKN